MILHLQNFREAVMVRRALDGHGEPLALAEIAVGRRQVRPETLREELARGISTVAAKADEGLTGWVADLGL